MKSKPHNLFQIHATLALVLMLHGCSTGPRQYDFHGPTVFYKRYYIQAPWTRLGVQEAYERCAVEVQSFRVINHYLCMKANGYEEK